MSSRHSKITTPLNAINLGLSVLAWAVFVLALMGIYLLAVDAIK